MNANRLLSHFERISDAPDAVDRLRRFILDLAVRGKLVEQDPGDEPCPSAAVVAQIPDAPFPVPASWRWIAFGGVHDLVRGVTYTKSDVGDSADEQHIAVLRANNIGARLNLDDLVYVRRRCVSDEQMLRQGDFLIALSSGSKNLVGKAASVEEPVDAAFGGFCGVVRLNDQDLRPYVRMYLSSPLYREAIAAGSRGIGINNLKRSTLDALPFPLPPLAEQHRIVEKVVELMQLCDRLETSHKERESRRDRLVVASLNRLSQPTDTDEFKKDARFQLSHLNRLSTKPEHIKELRKAILNLAFTNGLPPMRGNSEKVSVGEVAQLQNGYAFKSQWFTPKGIRLLRNANVGHGHLDWTEAVCLSKEQAGEYERFELRAGDIVLSLDRPFISTGTKVARVAPRDLPSLLLQRVGRFVIQEDRLDADYLFRWLKSPAFAAQVDPGRSLGVPHISSKNVESAEIPLPPLAEQKRIVAKVNELMLICDHLENQLEYQQKGRRQLLEALLHEALEGVG